MVVHPILGAAGIAAGAGAGTDAGSAYHWVMPELPDVTVYVECLERRVVGTVLEGIRLGSPFVLRTVAPRPDELSGRPVTAVTRLGKRIVLELEGALFAVVHLMIAGRLRWRERGVAVPKRLGQAAFDFPAGTLLLTEAGSKRRAGAADPLCRLRV